MAKSLAQYEAETLARWNQKRGAVTVRVQLAVNKVLQNTTIKAAARVRLAGQLLLDAVRVNLSRPVRKIKRTYTKVDPTTGTKTKHTRIVVDRKSRSKPGEFPRADTTRLMKDVFHSHDPSVPVSRIGTTLDYGLFLEVKLNRSFLRRTLNEMRAELLLIIQGANNVGLH